MDLKELMEPKRYEDSGIDERILRAVKEMGFESMTPIQEQAIPALLAGKDIIGQAQTGTGKTAAFGIPMIQMIDPDIKGTQCIILCPTRELAIQAADEIRKYAKFLPGIKVLPIYGGQDISKQIRSLSGNVQVVVGTPGRVMDHMRRHTLKLKNIRTIVLDEADEMLNMGFREDIETILKEIPEEHQTALFSATMPQAILDITHTYQRDDTENIQIKRKELTIPLVKQYYYEVKRQNKEEVCARLLDYYNPKLSLIFCNTKRMVDDLAESLKGRGYFAEGLHGDLSQAQRDKVMNSFRSGTTEILIATDVAARGIDVDDVEAVFNYDVPQDIEYYVHRIGRTGRAGRTGRSFTLVVGKEIYKIREIERVCHTKIKPRAVPSAADITAVKSDKIIADALKVLQENDVDKMIKIIETKLDEEDCTAIELAAAFLKQQMGEEIADIPVEEYRPEHRGYGNRENGRYGRNDKNRDHSDYKKRDDKSRGDYKKRDYKKRDDDRKPSKKGLKYGDAENFFAREEKQKPYEYHKDEKKREHKEKYDIRNDGTLMVKKKKPFKKKENKMSLTEYAKVKKIKD